MRYEDLPAGAVVPWYQCGCILRATGIIAPAGHGRIEIGSTKHAHRGAQLFDVIRKCGDECLVAQWCEPEGFYVRGHRVPGYDPLAIELDAAYEG